MHTFDALGAATSTFVCGSSGTCTGSTKATQEAFLALQTQINRVGVTYGITKLSVDGKLGPKTLQAMTNLARALAANLGGNLDPAIEELVIETDVPVTTQTLALNAERLADALSRDGARASTWSVLTTIRDVAQQIVTQGAAAPQLPPASGGTPIDPYTSPTVVQPAPVPPPVTAPNVWSYPPPVAPPASAMPALPDRRTPGWAIAAGIGFVAVIGGVVAAFARR